MARRPLVRFPDGTYYRESLDYTPRERLRVVLGYVIATAVAIAFVLLVSLPGRA